MALPKHQWTPEEYLDFERKADTKHEYLDGEIYDMSGASKEHVIITGNLSFKLHQQLEQRDDCIPYGNDLRVRVSKKHYTYPDLTVVCGETRLADDDHQDVLLNPTLIIEVLSPSTEQYDRNRKFQSYRTLASLQEYVMVSQQEPLIERYLRQPNGDWLPSMAQGLDASITLPSIDCTLALADVYRRITFNTTDDAS